MILHELPVLAIKALVGGSMVVLFALCAEMLKPKFFAGLFGAAPSVATASLIVAAFSSGPSHATTNAVGMAFGAVGLIAYCLSAAWLVLRLGAGIGSILGWGVWAAVSLGLYALFLS